MTSATETVAQPNASHTPAPWTTSGHFVKAGDRIVAEAFTLPTPYLPSSANARLIAAAPDLLALLDDVREFLDNYLDVNDGDDGQPRPNAAMQLDAEIQRVQAKARGERWPS